MLGADPLSLDQLPVLADAIPQQHAGKRVQAVLRTKQGSTAAHIAPSLSGSLWGLSLNLDHRVFSVYPMSEIRNDGSGASFH